MVSGWTGPRSSDSIPAESPPAIGAAVRGPVRIGSPDRADFRARLTRIGAEGPHAPPQGSGVSVQRSPNDPRPLSQMAKGIATGRARRGGGTLRARSGRMAPGYPRRRVLHRLLDRLIDLLRQHG